MIRLLTQSSFRPSEKGEFEARTHTHREVEALDVQCACCIGWQLQLRFAFHWFQVQDAMNSEVFDGIKLSLQLALKL